MKRKFYVLTFLFITVVGNILFAQQDVNAPYYHRLSPRPQADPGPEIVSNSVGYSNTGSNIDVVYHRCDWTIDPTAAKNIAGTVTTYFKTLSANVSSLTFDLNKTSFNNASLIVTYHGTVCTRSFPASGAIDTLTITLPVTITAAGTLDSVSIAYSGAPPAVSGQAEGYQRKQDGLSNWYIYTLSESYEDKDWWPCKADMQDKIDSMDINVTVPSAYWVAANGKMVDSSISGANRVFRFKHRHPIASYLVALGVAKYNRFHRPPITIGATNIPVVYNIFPDQGANPTSMLTAMDRSKLEVVEFSNMYGLYPFADEKHGYYQFGWGGGMEHQSFSAMSAGSMTSWSVIAHELGHQWFGDNVSFATWNDLWLAEGFARYSEVLAAEKVSALGQNAYSVRNTLKNGAGGAMSFPTTETWIPNANIANSQTIWSSNYGSSVYERGGMVVSMLRTLAGDAKFTEALTNYQTALAGKSATTDSLKRFFNTALGADLTEFFNDYVGGSGSGTTSVGGKGSPRYGINWNTRPGNQLVLQVGSQTKTTGNNVTYFNGPVVIHATNAASGWTKDTTIVFFDWGGGNLSTAGNGLGAPIAGNMLVYNLSFTATNIFIDDSARTLIDATNSTTTKLAALAADPAIFTAQHVNGYNNVKLLLEANEPVLKVQLERSADGVHFVQYGEMLLTNTSGTQLTYLFTDATPFDDATFYRAKIFTAGSEKYTSIVKVQQNARTEVVVSPNPADKFVNISFANATAEKVTVRITGADGKVVAEIPTTNNYIHVDTQKLAAGTYIMQLVKQGGMIGATSRFVVYH
ncbi:MAG: M1 family aminopeptidase [Ferruginibacter sp.]